MSQINPHPQYVDGLELRIRELSEQLAALRKDASSKWAFLEWRDRAEKAEAENAAQLDELHRISEALGTNDGHSSVTHIEILKGENAKLRELLRLCKPAVRNVYPSTDPLLEAIDAAMKEEGEMSDGTTHWAGCSESGAKHYKCALLEISRLRDTVTDLRNKLEKKTWFSAYEKKPWVGLTDEDREECLAKNEELGWWGVVNAIEQSLKEKNDG